jgi:predicted metal-dependent phosphoesterase TrpH
MSEIDLHTHSTASDGTLRPAELVAAAVAAGLKAMALTDHDTVQGLPEACAAGRELGIEVIGGCELSVRFEHGSMHLLGLWLPERPAHLHDTLERLSNLRKARNENIIANLQGYGVDISYAELEEITDGGSIGRPHFAQLLVTKGLAVNFQDAFMNWLRPGTKGYAPKEKLSPREAIELLKDEQATVILAHPCTLKIEKDELEGLLRELKDFGLDGVEVFYSMHSQAQTNFYSGLCRKLDLLQSAGSDFHGDNKPGIALGRGKGGLRPSYDLVLRMKEARRQSGLQLPICS